ncbi:MAG: hypothetical protein AAGF59_10775 [Pseudomonadota bacterium]
MPKLGFQIDTCKNIVVFWKDPNTTTKRITDDAMLAGFRNFKIAESPTVWALRNNYFTILAHGEPEHLVGLNDQESLGWTHNFIHAYGKGRPVCLLSCLTGQALAQKVAFMNKVTVVASLGFSTIDEKGSVYCGVPYVDGQWHGDKPEPLDWIKVQPDGQSVRAGKAELEPGFL